MKFCIDFSFIWFYFGCYILFIVYRVAVKFFFGNVAVFFQMSLYFSNNFSNFIKKDIHLVLSKSLLYALMFGRNMHNGLFFGIFIANKMKRNLLRYYWFINIYVIYWNRPFILVKFVFSNFSIIILYNFWSFFYMILNYFFIYIFFQF